MHRGVLLGLLLLALTAGCETLRPPLDHRTTQGPGAEEFWIYRTVLQNGREPTFEERQYWADELDSRISRYLREHPEAASALDVSTFRFYRRTAVGMTKEQVLILLGQPQVTTTDAAVMEQLARRFWPAVQATATEAWVYPLGWTLYFNGARLADITQYLPR